MLGREICRLLEARKKPFIATDRKTVNIALLEDVSDFIRTQKITHVINCAAYTNVDKAEEEQKEAYFVNALGPYHLGIAGRKHGARVLHFSTDYVFNGKSSLPYSEDYPCSPISAYGMSKLAGEIKLLDEHQHACIVRTSWLFGQGGKNFVESMLNVMREKETIQVVSDQRGRPTYCADLAEAAFELIDQQGIYHFANAGETSWFHFAQEIQGQALGLGEKLRVKTIDPIRADEYRAIAKRPANSVLSTKKYEDFSRKKPRSWTEALRQYLHLRDSTKKLAGI